MDNLLNLVSAVEAAGVDIAPSYSEYVRVALAIATEYSESGRDCFHRLCRLSNKYDARNADRLYSDVLKNGHGRVHIGTVYYLASLKGVKVQEAVAVPPPVDAADAAMQSVKVSHTRTREGSERIDASTSLSMTGKESRITGTDDELLPGSEPNQALPLFPEAEWPEPLQKILSYGRTGAQRDVLFLGAITILGGTLERYVRCPYGGRLLSPCLQTFVVAPPASGKGVLSWVRQLAEPIHNEIRGEVEREMKAYQKEKSAYDLLGKERAEKEPPEKPVNRMLLISGDNTNTGMLQNLLDSDGTGIICETEADTISTAIGSEYGHWSDTLRKAFDHERLSYNRRTNQEYREVRKSYLSVLLSGTPAQVKPLIPSAENGLFSRQVFYYMPGIRVWQNQFDRDDTDLETIFAALGKEWKQRLHELKRQGVFTLRLTEEQKREFNRRFSSLFLRAGVANGNEMNSSVARLAINLCRILSVVAVLRGDFTPDKGLPTDNLKDKIIPRWDVSVREGDFLAVLGLIEPLYRHATHILSFLPGTELQRRNNAERDAFFASLPDAFTRKQVIERAKAMHINPNTAISWIQRLAKRGLLIATENEGEYLRARVCEKE